MRKRSTALLVGVVATAGIVAALVGPCDATRVGAPTLDVQPASATDVAAVATPTRVRRTKPASNADVGDDGERFALRVRVVAEKTQTSIVGAAIAVGDDRAATGADGEATVERLRRGCTDVEVRARGFLRKRQLAAVPNDDPPVVVELAPGVVVPVEVVDAATGRPVSGATLKFVPAGDANESRREEFVTDAAGRAEANLPPGVAFSVRTHARGHFETLDLVRTVALDAPQPRLRVTLAPSVALRGVVRDPDGNPADALVCIAREDGDDAGDEFDCVTTDSAGAYEIDGLEVGASYAAWAPASGDWSPSTRIVVTAGRDGAVADLRLRKPGTLDLTVVDEDGETIQGLFLKVSGDGAESSSSGGIGVATESLAPGRYVLKAWTIDRVPVSETIDVAEGATVKRRIVLSTGEVVAGVVVDDSGAPVEDAHIRAAEPEVDATAPTPWARTDENGRFALVQIAKGAHDLVVDPPYEFEKVVVRAVAAPSEHRQFVVARRGTLALHVVFDDAARPASNAKIAFHGDQNGEPWDIDRPLPDDGRFEIAWPAGVRGELGIVVDGFLPVARAVNVPAGASVDLGEVRMRRGASLVGVVRASGPDSNYPYTLVVRGVWRGGRCTTDADGRFAFDGLATGEVRIDVEKSQCSFRVAVPSREPVVLDVQSSVLLNATLTDAAGAPVAGRRIVVRDAAGEQVSEGTTDARGVSWHSLPPGKYAVDADHGPRADVEIRAGDVAVVVKLR